MWWRESQLLGVVLEGEGEGEAVVELSLHLDRDKHCVEIKTWSVHVLALSLSVLHSSPLPSPPPSLLPPPSSPSLLPSLSLPSPPSLLLPSPSPPLSLSSLPSPPSLPPPPSLSPFPLAPSHTTLSPGPLLCLTANPDTLTAIAQLIDGTILRYDSGCLLPWQLPSGQELRFPEQACDHTTLATFNRQVCRCLD